MQNSTNEDYYFGKKKDITSPTIQLSGGTSNKIRTIQTRLAWQFESVQGFTFEEANNCFRI